MTGIVHINLPFILPIAILGFNDLTDCEHRIRELSKVTTSNNEHLSVLYTNLDRLEVVREVLLGCDRISSNCLRACIIDVELLRVFLHDINF